MEKFPWSACLKVAPGGQKADLIDAPWRSEKDGYDCSLDKTRHYMPTCCSNHEEDMPQLLSPDTLKIDCRHSNGAEFEWPPQTQG
ncbi:hypothetical protein PSTG_04513 [Puccinia striiformis f. sp. tritici PST-78]|nr:hypothetical protein PSTG_04513 [Puccinia striiformis f. sp. tritici PST-78]